MTIETRVFELLNTDADLIGEMAEIRGKLSPCIFKHDIPEEYQKRELAPFIRLSPLYEGDRQYADDGAMAEEQRIQISFWTKTDEQAEVIKQHLDRILKSHDFIRYTANENPRYKDSDIDLLINHRKYRFFDWKNKEEI